MRRPIKRLLRDLREQIAELELIGLQELRRLRYMGGNPGEGVAEIRLLRRSIRRVQLEEWIAWKDADNAWRKPASTGSP
jgi:hypothetical protein